MEHTPPEGKPELGPRRGGVDAGARGRERFLSCLHRCTPWAQGTGQLWQAQPSRRDHQPGTGWSRQLGASLLATPGGVMDALARSRRAKTWRSKMCCRAVDCSPHNPNSRYRAASHPRGDTLCPP